MPCRGLAAAAPFRHPAAESCKGSLPRVQTFPKLLLRFGLFRSAVAAWDRSLTSFQCVYGSTTAVKQRNMLLPIVFDTWDVGGHPTE